jgi:hypothetical protein
MKIIVTSKAAARTAIAICSIKNQALLLEFTSGPGVGTVPSSVFGMQVGSR